jgi:hypothetical protein
MLAWGAFVMGGQALNGQIERFGGSAGENKFSWGDAQDLGEGGSGFGYGVVSFFAEEVGACGVGESF